MKIQILSAPRNPPIFPATVIDVLNMGQHCARQKSTCKTNVNEINPIKPIEIIELNFKNQIIII
jgi:hypothetical protein